MDWAHACTFVIMYKQVDSSWWIQVIHLPIFYSVVSWLFGQSVDCHGVTEVILKDMGYIDCLLFNLLRPSDAYMRL